MYARSLCLSVVMVLAMIIGSVPAFSFPEAADPFVDAIEIKAPVSGVIGKGQEVWFKVYGDGKPVGIVINYLPGPDGDTTAAHEMDVSFRVLIRVKPGLDWTYQEIGRGTESGLGSGVKYWRGGADSPQWYFIVLQNNSSGPINGAIASVGDTFPPPRLNMSATPSLAPIPACSSQSDACCLILAETSLIQQALWRQLAELMVGRGLVSMDEAIAGFNSKDKNRQSMMSFLIAGAIAGTELGNYLNLAAKKLDYYKTLSDSGISCQPVGTEERVCDEAIGEIEQEQQQLWRQLGELMVSRGLVTPEEALAGYTSRDKNRQRAMWIMIAGATAGTELGKNINVINKKLDYYKALRDAGFPCQ
jgi:hypothetical protein